MNGTARRGRIGTILLMVVLAACLAFVIRAFLAAWRMAGNVTMSIHGWIALSIAFIFTGLLGGGLMALAYYSSRRGYDDNVARTEDADALDSVSDDPGANA